MYPGAPVLAADSQGAPRKNGQDPTGRGAHAPRGGGVPHTLAPASSSLPPPRLDPALPTLFGLPYCARRGVPVQKHRAEIMLYKIVVASSIAAAAAFAPDATVGDVKDAAWDALCRCASDEGEQLCPPDRRRKRFSIERHVLT